MDSSEWAGRVGEVWAEEWRRTDRTFVPVDSALMTAAAEAVAGVTAPRILDVGCGAGTTSLSMAERFPGASITGIDLSPMLLDVARSRAEDRPRCRFEQGDASEWSGATDFDLLVSRHGVMFFADPVAAFAHLRSLARPDGALVFSCFRTPAENVWASGLAHLMPGVAGDPHAPGPFAFADRDYVVDLLARAGWRNVRPQPFDYDYVAGAGDDPVGDAIAFFRRIGPTARAFRELDEAGRARLFEALGALIRAHRAEAKVSFPAAGWIWSATA